MAFEIIHGKFLDSPSFIREKFLLACWHTSPLVPRSSPLLKREYLYYFLVFPFVPRRRRRRRLLIVFISLVLRERVFSLFSRSPVSLATVR